MTVTLSSKVGLLTSPLQGPLDLNNKPVYQTQYSNGNSGATATTLVLASPTKVRQIFMSVNTLLKISQLHVKMKPLAI